ncbi:MAG: rod shape-determining protein MreD [Verrucomicrobia bacterium]|nr:rod shape-determining protein MreD [Verrucomicrobiota bacterium]
MRRTLVLSLTLLLLWTLVAEANHLLTGLRVYLFVGALYIAYAALAQPFRSGLAASLVGGLICDANAPGSSFGTHTLLFAAAHAGVFHLRDRLPRDDPTSRVIIALLANLALFLVFSFSQMHRLPAPAAAWPRLFADLVCSQILLALIAPWFFAVQSRALLLARVERETLA